MIMQQLIFLREVCPMTQKPRTLKKEISKDEFLPKIQEKGFKYLQEYRN